MKFKMAHHDNNSPVTGLLGFMYKKEAWVASSGKKGLTVRKAL